MKCYLTETVENSTHKNWSVSQVESALTAKILSKVLGLTLKKGQVTKELEGVVSNVLCRKESSTGATLFLIVFLLPLCLF